VKEVSNTEGYDVESNALKHNISSHKQKQVAWAENNIYPHRLLRS